MIRGRCRATTALVTVLLGLGSACSDRPSGASAGAHPTTAVAADVDDDGTAPAGPLASVVASSVRDGDEVDIGALASEMAEGAAGPDEWIAVFTELRAASWLASRYPGRYDVLEIYADYWAEETAAPNQAQWLAEGVYLDEPLPSVVSVVVIEERGGFVELDVVLDTGEAIIRRERDDGIEGTFPGGRVRGRFTISPDGTGGRWRIHSIVELVLAEPDDTADVTADPAADAEEQSS